MKKVNRISVCLFLMIAYGQPIESILDRKTTIATSMVLTTTTTTLSTGQVAAKTKITSESHSLQNRAADSNQQDDESSNEINQELSSTNNPRAEPDYFYTEPQSTQSIFPSIDGIASQSEHDELQLHLSSLQNRWPDTIVNRLPDKDYLSHELAEKACRSDRGCQRKDKLNNTYLSNCNRHKLENLLSNEMLMSIMHESSEECERILDEFIQLDEQIDYFDQLFKTLLQRYNCHNGYSVKWNCEDCKRAYKDWLCTTNLPYYMNGERIKPCISFCERVEQRCPYLHPITREQYGGQPAFICRDPNIPNVPEITPDIYYSEPQKCYDLCHLSVDMRELKADSLSKYHPSKCPSKSLIAEHVRNDQLTCQPPLTSTPDPLERESIGSNASSGPDLLPIHMRKLTELRDVMINYKNQPTVNKFAHHNQQQHQQPISISHLRSDPSSVSATRDTPKNHWILDERLPARSLLTAENKHHSIWTNM